MVRNDTYVGIQQSHWWLPQGHIHEVCKVLQDKQLLSGFLFGFKLFQKQKRLNKNWMS